MILNISEAANLGIHALTYLATHQKGKEAISTIQVAKAYGVSENHLSKVFQRLTKVGLVKSIRGPKGGFVLARNPEDISLLEIYEAIDGHLKSESHCMLGTPSCGYKECVYGTLTKNIEEEVHSHFANRTLADLK